MNGAERPLRGRKDGDFCATNPSPSSRHDHHGLSIIGVEAPTSLRLRVDAVHPAQTSQDSNLQPSVLETDALPIELEAFTGAFGPSLPDLPHGRSQSHLVSA